MNKWDGKLYSLITHASLYVVDTVKCNKFIYFCQNPSIQIFGIKQLLDASSLINLCDNVQW